MTAVSGFAQNYLQLLLARIGVGIGEAGGSPDLVCLLRLAAQQVRYGTNADRRMPTANPAGARWKRS